jgi:hypothetical protein
MDMQQNIVNYVGCTTITTTYYMMSLTDVWRLVQVRSLLFLREDLLGTPICDMPLIRLALLY